MWYYDEDENDKLMMVSAHLDLHYNEKSIPRLLSEGNSTQKERLTLSSKLRNEGTVKCSVCLFGSVPPRKNLGEEAVNKFADVLGRTLRTMEGIDGLTIYDIQDEEGRHGERPFAFAATHEPRVFATKLKEITNLEAIIYHTVPYYQKEGFEQWLGDTWEKFGVHNMVLVGGGSSRVQYPGYSVTEAAQIAVKIKDFSLGGISLPERHRDKGSEHELLLRKTSNGMSFFTSQVNYNADLAIWLLRDYDELCKEKEKKPARIIFTFAPFGRADTVKFLKWLGVEIPEGTEKRVLSRKTAAARVQESIDICRENLKRILDAAHYYNVAVPLGITVECVSKYKDEFEGSVQLFKLLHKELKEYDRKMNPILHV